MSAIPNAVRATCPTCEGRGWWQSNPGGEQWPCHRCEVASEEVLQLIERKMTDAQRRFLNFGAHTMAEQSASPEDWDDVLLCGFYVEADDEVDLGDGYTWPATMHWFGMSRASYGGDGGPWDLAFSYNGTGIALRERASGTSASGQDGNRLGGEAPQARPDAQTIDLKGIPND